MRILVAPDSFKGSLTAVEAAEAIAAGVRGVLPGAQLRLLPLADGGEGTVAAWLRAGGGQSVGCRVTGPMGDTVDAGYGLLPDGTVVIETASASGLLLVSPEHRCPLHATTYGVGELIRTALNSGACRLMVGLGGSATNDGGAGALQALGVRFLDRRGRPLPAPITAAMLPSAARLDAAPMIAAYAPLARTMVLAADVANPLTGPNGASYVYGPQKGATPAMVEVLDGILAEFGALLKRDLGRDVAQMPGAGAAGGLGGGLLALFGATLRSGIDLLLEHVRFETLLADTDLVIAGEGSIDSQTLQGKAVAGVLKRAQAASVPVVAFGGRVDPDAVAALRRRGLRAAYAVSPPEMPAGEAMSQARTLLEAAAARAAPDFPAVNLP